MILLYILLIAYALLVLGLLAWQASNIISMALGAPAISSPRNNFWPELVARDSSLYKKSIIDLGCGAGSACIAMAPHFRRVYGMEFSPFYFLLAKWRTRKLKNVTIIFGNILKAPWPKTEYVYCYLLSPVMAALLPRFNEEQRIVLSLTFPIQGANHGSLLEKDDKKLWIYDFH
jgi:SAM-dependent methyltransferase